MAHTFPSQASPVIGVFCRTLEKGGDPFSNAYYWQAYKDLVLGLKERGAQAYLLSNNDTYRGYDGMFDVAYTINHDTTLDTLEKVHDVHVDLIFDRGRFIGRDIAVINPPILTQIASSKIEMYEYFSNLQPYSFIGTSKKDVIKAAKRLPGEKLVVKEPEGYGGNEVIIGEKDEVLAQLPKNYPVLVQEFSDTSEGVPGQIDGTHDVRVALCGSDIVSYYARVPAEGDLRANVAQGGSVIHFNAQEVPKTLKDIVYEIDALFADQPRYYSLDFMNTTKGWKLVELNSYLGLDPMGNDPEVQNTNKKLIDYLIREANKILSVSE